MNLAEYFLTKSIKGDDWSPGYESAIQIDLEDENESSTIIDYMEVPIEKWKPINPDSCELPETIAFVDGVRRIDRRVTQESEKDIIYGAFGTLAVGGIVMKLNEQNIMRTAIQHPTIRYLFLLGQKELPFEKMYKIKSNMNEVVDINLEAIGLDVNDPTAPVNKLQEEMRAEEGNVADKIINNFPLVIRDGPLHRLINLGDRQILGYIKSIHKFYISRELMPVVFSLKKGERTPFFKIEYPDKKGGNAYSVISWYIRLNNITSRDSNLSGIVRLEMQSGLEDKAKYLADLTATLLPGFASTRIRDPRAPQNLLPIEALEKELRRRMGNPEIIKRRIEKLLAGY